MNKVKKKGKSLEELLEEALVPVEEQPYEVPGNWVWVKLSPGYSLCLDKYRKPINSSERASRIGIVPYYGATGQVGWIDDYLTDEELVLLGEDGAPFFDPLKSKAYLIQGKSWVNNHAHILKSNYGSLGNIYMLHYLNQFNFNGYVSGSTRLKLTQKKMSEIPIPLPPLTEQKRIANKIESLFAKIDEAKQLIEEAKESFELRQAAILDKAFRGELTRDWHQKHANVESDFQRKPNNTASLPWKMVDIESIAKKEKYSVAIGPFGSNLKVTDYSSSGVPLVFVRNIRSFKYDLDQKFVSIEKAETLLPHIIESNDILITKMGDPPGDADIYPVGLPKAIITSDCIKLKVDEEVIINEFVLYAIRSPFFQKQIREKSKGVAQQKISLDSFKKMKIYLPPISEQLVIVNLLRNSFESMQQESELLQQIGEEIDNLRQSILQKAFRGELGTNDPTEESAIELLKENLNNQLN
ncbi:restriction endonuclease subunit S [Saccharibacillus sp. JS10]|uniref:restriction endonuclease subunit S n=1 Tax=Saccharibacillus sp. JS10 TaxID=2950552 RepID=UPI00210928E1|nr:restriction endonuclease subunit S [Saccharibacillus sp. JS10]MCQ4085943.1 restriction endonuclease subunit S [Saccharibacillus sp. JS10]